MRNTIAVFGVLALTAVLALPAYQVEEDTGTGTHLVSIVDTTHEAALAADVLVFSSAVSVLMAPENIAELVPSPGRTDCKSVRLEKVPGIQLRKVSLDYKPHGHWLC